jgi:HSP20 family protein
LLKADLPGASAESISLDYNGGNLVLHAAVAARQPENTTYLIREYGVSDFHREFQVNEEIDSGKIAAEYRDGVLTVHLPKAEAAKPRRIEVKAN